MNLSYLLGYFTADGYSPVKHPNKDGGSLCYAETKDLDFANELNRIYGRGDVRGRIRVMDSGVKCHIYSVKFSKSFSNDIVRNMDGYKNYVGYFKRLSLQEQFDFIQGLIDGDGSICAYSGKLTCRVIIYSAEPSTSELIDYWCDLNKMAFSKYSDDRGHHIDIYNFSHRSSLSKMYKYFRFRMLPRKIDVLCNAMSTYKWFLCDNEYYTCDRALIQSKLGLTPGDIHYAFTHKVKSKEHSILEVPFSDVVKDRIWI